MPVQRSWMRSRVAPHAVTLAAVLVTMLALAGCGRIEATVETSSALRKAGIRDPVVTIEKDGRRQIVTVAYASRSGVGPSLDREQDLVARTVWRTANVPLDVVRVSPAGDALQAPPPRPYDRAELTRRFGERPASLDDELPPSTAVRTGVVVTLLSILLVVALGLVGLWGFVRYRRRRPAEPPWLTGPGYPGWGNQERMEVGTTVYAQPTPWQQKAPPSSTGYPQARSPAGRRPASSSAESWPAEDDDDTEVTRGPTGKPPAGDDPSGR